MGYADRSHGLARLRCFVALAVSVSCHAAKRPSMYVFGRDAFMYQPRI